jgi:hypothetical protein
VNVYQPVYLPEWFMDRYRGTPGVFGELVKRADVECLKDLVQTVAEVAAAEKSESDKAAETLYALVDAICDKDVVDREKR